MGNFGFLKLDRNLNVVDWFTPTNHLQLDKDDNDLNSSGAILIPGTHLVAGGGKEGILYLLDTEHLGHLGDENSVQRLRVTSSHLHGLVFWESAKKGRLLYLWGQRDRLRAYKFTAGKLEDTPLMARSEANEGHPGAMLSLSPPAVDSRNSISVTPSIVLVRLGMPAAPESCCAP